jgi:hypothetical protein
MPKKISKYAQVAKLLKQKGKVIILSSDNFSDFFMQQCHQEIQDYLEKRGGEVND